MILGKGSLSSISTVRTAPPLHCMLLARQCLLVSPDRNKVEHDEFSHSHHAQVAELCSYFFCIRSTAHIYSTWEPAWQAWRGADSPQAGSLLEKAASREVGSKNYCLKDDGTFQNMVKIVDQIHCWNQKLLVFHTLAFPMKEVILGCSELPKPETCAKALQYLGHDWNLAQELYAEPLRSTPIQIGRKSSLRAKPSNNILKTDEEWRKLPLNS